MKILEDKENPLLNRREAKVIVEAGKNPSFEEAENLIAEKFNAGKELIEVKSIKGKFGRNTFLIEAFIYKTKEDKEKLEKKKTAEKTKEQQTQQPITEQKQEEKREEK